MKASISLYGDAGLRIVWPDVPESETLSVLLNSIQTLLSSGLQRSQLIPGFAALTILFEDRTIDIREQQSKVEFVLSQMRHGTCDVPTRQVSIPVCFEEEFAWDLPLLLERTGLERAECVRRFLSLRFRVRMIGFAPGFPYLSGLPEEFHLARRATPRLNVPAGSVAIGGRQAGIYPQSSPGGWNVIGRTNTRLFDPSNSSSPCLLEPGDVVTFHAVTRAELEQTV